jgi:hypothetical protein
MSAFLPRLQSLYARPAEFPNPKPRLEFAALRACGRLRVLRALPGALSVLKAGPGYRYDHADIHFHCKHLSDDSHEAIAFNVLRADDEYISQVTPRKMRLMPTRVPIAHTELNGQGRQIR